MGDNNTEKIIIKKEGKVIVIFLENYNDALKNVGLRQFATDYFAEFFLDLCRYVDDKKTYKNYKKQIDSGELKKLIKGKHPIKVKIYAASNKGAQIAGIWYITGQTVSFVYAAGKTSYDYMLHPEKFKNEDFDTIFNDLKTELADFIIKKSKLLEDKPHYDFFDNYSNGIKYFSINKTSGRAIPTLVEALWRSKWVATLWDNSSNKHHRIMAIMGFYIIFSELFGIYKGIKGYFTKSKTQKANYFKSLFADYKLTTPPKNSTTYEKWNFYRKRSLGYLGYDDPPFALGNFRRLVWFSWASVRSVLETSFFFSLGDIFKVRPIKAAKTFFGSIRSGIAFLYTIALSGAIWFGAHVGSILAATYFIAKETGFIDRASLYTKSYLEQIIPFYIQNEYIKRQILEYTRKPTHPKVIKFKNKFSKIIYDHIKKYENKVLSKKQIYQKQASFNRIIFHLYGITVEDQKKLRNKGNGAQRFLNRVRETTKQIISIMGEELAEKEKEQKLYLRLSKNASSNGNWSKLYKQIHIKNSSINKRLRGLVSKYIRLAYGFDVKFKQLCGKEVTPIEHALRYRGSFPTDEINQAKKETYNNSNKSKNNTHNKAEKSKQKTSSSSTTNLPNSRPLTSPVPTVTWGTIFNKLPFHEKFYGAYSYFNKFSWFNSLTYHGKVIVFRISSSARFFSTEFIPFGDVFFAWKDAHHNIVNAFYQTGQYFKIYSQHYWQIYGKPITDAFVSNWYKVTRPILDTIGHRWNTYIRPVLDNIAHRYNSTIKPIFDAIGNKWNQYGKPIINTVAQRWNQYGKPIFDTVIQRWNNSIKPLISSNLNISSIWSSITNNINNTRSLFQFYRHTLSTLWDHYIKSPFFRTIQHTKSMLQYFYIDFRYHVVPNILNQLSLAKDYAINSLKANIQRTKSLFQFYGAYIRHYLIPNTLRSLSTAGRYLAQNLNRFRSAIIGGAFSYWAVGRHVLAHVGRTVFIGISGIGMAAVAKFVAIAAGVVAIGCYAFNVGGFRNKVNDVVSNFFSGIYNFFSSEKKKNSTESPEKSIRKGDLSKENTIVLDNETQIKLEPIEKNIIVNKTYTHIPHNLSSPKIFSKKIDLKKPTVRFFYLDFYIEAVPYFITEKDCLFVTNKFDKKGNKLDQKTANSRAFIIRMLSETQITIYHLEAPKNQKILLYSEKNILIPIIHNLSSKLCLQPRATFTNDFSFYKIISPIVIGKSVNRDIISKLMQKDKNLSYANLVNRRDIPEKYGIHTSRNVTKHEIPKNELYLKAKRITSLNKISERNTKGIFTFIKKTIRKNSYEAPTIYSKNNNSFSIPLKKEANQSSLSFSD